MPVPTHYNRLMPYLILAGAQDFIEFMKYVFDATEQMIVPRSEGKIMHGELRIVDSVIMFADSIEEIGPRPAGLLFM